MLTYRVLYSIVETKESNCFFHFNGRFYQSVAIKNSATNYPIAIEDLSDFNICGWSNFYLLLNSELMSALEDDDFWAFDCPFSVFKVT